MQKVFNTSHRSWANQWMETCGVNWSYI